MGGCQIAGITESDQFTVCQGNSVRTYLAATVSINDTDITGGHSNNDTDVPGVSGGVILEEYITNFWRVRATPSSTIIVASHLTKTRVHGHGSSGAGDD